MIFGDFFFYRISTKSSENLLCIMTFEKKFEVCKFFSHLLFSVYIFYQMGFPKSLHHNFCNSELKKKKKKKKLGEGGAEMCND